MDSGLQVVDPALEPFFQAQLDGGYEGMQSAFRVGDNADWQKDANRFGDKLPVQVEAVEEVLVALLVFGRAGEGMRRLLLALAPILHLAATSAEGESFTRHLDTGDGRLLADFSPLTEVDFTEIDLGQEVEAEGEICVHLEGLSDLLVVEFHQHLFVVKNRVAVIGVVADAAFPVRGGGEDLAHSQHQPLLAGIAPHRAAAMDADLPFFVFAQQFLVRAVVAESPGLDLGDRHIDLVHPHLATFGVEGVCWSQLLDGASCRPLILEVPGFIAAAALLHLALLAVDEGIEHDPHFREGVVGQQPLVGEEVEGVSVAEAADQGLEGRFFDGQFPHLRLEVHVVGSVLFFLDLGVEGLNFLLERGPFQLATVQTVHDPAAQKPLLLAVAFDKMTQVFHGLFAQPDAVILEEQDEMIEQIGLVGLDVLDEIVRKLFRINGFQVAEHLPQLFGDGRTGSVGNPAVEAEGGQLSFQDCRSIEENARGIDMAGDHFLGFGEEKEVMRPGVGHGQVEGVPVPATGPTDPLKIIRLRGWHRAEHQ